ncbi:peptidoglycan D,D-transpeptidase FtsI family protein [Ornithinicoccus hortensis]|uniref:Cell elongation-specific peptidoglycan D,D-transpeptidase n=1 Tax=Ornithinicoccus hortensis TaxID=82346 RepID=A0A542YMY6_9MICO|nr:penicillin-binding transpeptidase domain-containing protein [Ornithinicoccus hortensis]TQL49463.1 cell elongation-specific peptidoglycan D,D-transpeptidase [Ornithinicoccus hortensis]
MNAPIRKLAVVVFAMFAALLIATTYIQFVQADQLRDQPGNRRTLLSNYSRDRGAILVDGDPIARSVDSGDELRRIREYPQGELYAHSTGYYSFIYGAGGGLELSKDALLSGTDDLLFYRRIVDLVTGTTPSGATLELTLDPEIQEAAAQALGDRRGAVVALDPRTGAILAMVSHPTYDPNVLASHQLGQVEDAWNELNNDDSRPMTNRAIAGDLYPPGSVFKLVVAAAALESGDFRPDSMLEGPLRYTLPNTTTELPNFGGAACAPTDEVSLADSVRVSCNTSFAWLAGELGADAIADQAASFGFGQSLQIPMSVTPSRYPSELDDAQVALTGIGQYDVRVTPMQVAMVSAAIANDGVVMEPYLVRTVRDQDLNTIEQTEPQELAEAISPKTAEELTAMMESVITDGSGTAAALPEVRVAGKTGTAEYGTNGAAHAWFTGFAPAGDPEIAVAVLVESASDDWTGETGGVVAAPIARAVLEAGVNR